MKMHWMSQEKLTRSKVDGGLGFMMAHAFNKALLAKQWWWIIHFEDSFMAKVFKAKYFPKFHPFEVFRSHNPSFAWSSILATKSIMEEGLVWHIGDDHQVHIWQYKWLLSIMDNKMCQEPNPGVDVNMIVSRLIDIEIGYWNQSFIDQIIPMEAKKHILFIPLRLQRERNKLIWKLNSDGCYSIKFVYKLQLAQFESNYTSSSVIT